MSIFQHFQSRYDEAQEECYTIQDFLSLCRNEPMAYASAAQRLLKAIGEPEMIDTSNEPCLSRIFSNRVIARYPAFDEFYGMEEAIEQIVDYLTHASQGLEEQKQILYLLGPVGGGKSSLAEKLKVVFLSKELTEALSSAKMSDSDNGEMYLYSNNPAIEYNPVPNPIK